MFICSLFLNNFNFFHYKWYVSFIICFVIINVCLEFKYFHMYLSSGWVNIVKKKKKKPASPHKQTCKWINTDFFPFVPEHDILKGPTDI